MVAEGDSSLGGWSQSSRGHVARIWGEGTRTDKIHGARVCRSRVSTCVFLGTCGHVCVRVRARVCVARGGVSRSVHLPTHMATSARTYVSVSVAQISARLPVCARPQGGTLGKRPPSEPAINRKPDRGPRTAPAATGRTRVAMERGCRARTEVGGPQYRADLGPTEGQQLASGAGAGLSHLRPRDFPGVLSQLEDQGASALCVCVWGVGALQTCRG